jgi:hypothetical protein
MKQQEFDNFCELLGVVSEQYGKPISTGAMMLYWQGLINHDFEAVKVALYRHIQNPDNGMFMPKIADIIRMLQGSTQDSAFNAWSKVDKAVRQVGTQVSVVFDDPIIHQVISDMGGWLSFGTKSEDEWPFVAKEFENRYRGFKARNEVIEYPKLLIGLYDAQNLPNGYKTTPPILIGDKEKAQQVLIGGTDKPSLQFTEQQSTFKQLSAIGGKP